MITAYVAVQALMLACIAGSGVFFFSRRKQNRTLRAFSYMCVGAVLWGGGQFALTCISLWLPDDNVYFWVNTLTYAGICVITPASVVTSWTYRGLYRLYGSRRILLALCVPSAVLFLFNATNPLHGLYYSRLTADGREYALLAYVSMVWSYLSVLYAGISLALYHRKQHPEYAKWFLLCSGFPLFTSALSMLMRDDRFDLTVPGLIVLMAGAGVLVFRHKLVSISPIAAKIILDGLGYPIKIMSTDGELLFENKAAREEGRVYETRGTRLPDGRLLLALTDVTRQMETLDELSLKSAELKELQIELERRMKSAEEYAAVAEAEAAQRSRLEIMGKLNSRVYVVINQIVENTERALNGSVPETEAIEKNISLTAEGIRMVRAIISEYKEARRHGL